MKTTSVWITALIALALVGAFNYPLQAEAKERAAPIAQVKKSTKRITVVINGKRFEVENTGKPLKISIEEDGKQIQELNLMVPGHEMLPLEGMRLKLDGDNFKELERLGAADGLKFKVDAQQFKELENLHKLDGLKADGLAKIYRLDAGKFKAMDKMNLAPLAELPLLWDASTSQEVKKALSAARESLSEQLRRTSDPELKKSLSQAIKAMEKAMEKSGSPTASKAMVAPKVLRSYKLAPEARVRVGPSLAPSAKRSDASSLVKSLTVKQLETMKEKGKLTPSDLTATQLEMLGVKQGSEDWSVTLSINGTEYKFSSK